MSRSTSPPVRRWRWSGETGAGKSTFAKLVARFYDPQRGRVLVDGHDLRELKAQCLRSQLGIVPQEGFLFSGTVRENICFGRPSASAEEVEAAADAIGAGEFIRRLPGGFETEVGERGVALSAGQRQLIAFARALLAEPRILILDEATSNVDVRTERTIESGLERLLQGRTAIVIAHRLSTIRGADRIAVLEHGSIAEIGSHDELIAAGGRYAALYGSWAELRGLGAGSSAPQLADAAAAAGRCRRRRYRRRRCRRRCRLRRVGGPARRERAWAGAGAAGVTAPSPSVVGAMPLVVAAR